MTSASFTVNREWPFWRYRWQLTLNPTSPYLDEWDARLTALGLERVRPRVPVISEVRSMHVAPEIAAVFEDGTKVAFPDVRADKQNTVFTAGFFTTVSLLGDPGKAKPDLERLTDLDEAWVVCYRSPKPGFRLFGRWVAQNVFVGLALWDRYKLTKSKHYQAKAAEMLTNWQANFPALPIIRGQEVQDYLTGSVRDVDQSPF